MIIVYGGCQADELVRDGQRLPWRAAEDLTGRLRGLIQSLEPKSLVGALGSGADILFAKAALRRSRNRRERALSCEAPPGHPARLPVPRPQGREGHAHRSSQRRS